MIHANARKRDLGPVVIVLLAPALSNFRCGHLLDDLAAALYSPARK
jgi:hypothetical protein